MKQKNAILGSILSRNDLKNDSLKQLKGGVKCSSCGYSGRYCIMPNGNYRCCTLIIHNGVGCLTSIPDLGCDGSGGALQCYCAHGLEYEPCE